MNVFKLAFACALVLSLPTTVAPQTSSSRPSTTSPKPTGSLAQIMRGIYFPNSNLIFDVQQHDPGAPPKPSDTGASATDRYANTYSGWEAVENAAVALTDSVDLILAPGRSCQNGKPVPVGQADFQKFARDMRTGRTCRFASGAHEESGEGV